MSTIFLGEIRLFARNAPPQHWHICDGTLLPVSGNEALYSLLGTTYGGDGVSTFGLPDLRGRLNISLGTGPGLTPRPAGQVGGFGVMALDEGSMPLHNHPINTTPADATTPTAGPNVGFGQLVNSDAMYLSPTAPNPTKLSPNAATIGSTGASAEHDNRMPSLSLNYIICTNGLYPNRS